MCSKDPYILTSLHPKIQIADMPGSLAPCLLLSMPQLLDRNFARTVVLLVKHGRDSGAFGLIVNRPLVTSGPVVVEVRAQSEQKSTTSSDRELEVWIGGPVEPNRSWILVGQDEGEHDDGTEVASGVYLSTSPELLSRLLGPAPPPRTRLIVGYSGWAPGQLEAELDASAWLISDVDREMIFTTPADQMWETAIRRLGADPAALHMSRGVH